MNRSGNKARAATARKAHSGGTAGRMQMKRRERAAPADKKHFSQGVNFYKLVWLYALGGLAGFLIEIVWCYHVYDVLEWHSAMAFTPFNPIYGAGAVVLFLSLRGMKKNNVLIIFLFSAAAGTLIELVASYFQEYFFHSYSWDYAHLPYNFEGRICLGMTAGWGLLGVAWVWLLSPALEKVLSFVPQKFGKVMAVLLVFVIVADATVTVGAMSRWLERRAEIPPGGELDLFFDRFFPDARMEFMFPRIKFFDKG